MRYILIDLSADNHLQRPKIFGGYAGEHNETILQVKLPNRMIDIECSGYRFDFQTSEENKIYSPLIPISELKNDIVSFRLVEQLTVAGELLCNVSAIRLDENDVSLISKTNSVVLCIENSPEGTAQLIDSKGYKDELTKMVDARILEISQPVVIDQNFNPESENAQSGKAVAEAIEAKPGEVTITGADYGQSAYASVRGERFNDYDDTNGNRALAAGSHAEGIRSIEYDGIKQTIIQNIAGCGCFEIDSKSVLGSYYYYPTFDTTNKTITVKGDATGYASGDVVSIITDTNFDECATITSVSYNGSDKTVITLQEWPEGLIQGSSNILFDSGNVVKSYVPMTLRVVAKPLVGTTYLGLGAHTEGIGSRALADGAHAEGNKTKASGNYSHAEGYYTTASGDASHAEGWRTTASSNYQHVQGKFSIEDKNNTYADIIGNGSSDTELSNAATVDWQGNAWYAGDVYVGSTSGTNRDEGSKKLATEDVVNTKMDKTNPTGTGSFSLNRKPDTTIGTNSHAEGNNTTASGDFSHAEGWYTTASRPASHAEGKGTQASGDSSHAEGKGTQASGDKSHAEGADTAASGNYSHAEGLNCESQGTFSHAEGGATIAVNQAAHSEGFRTLSQGEASHSEGYYAQSIGDSSHSEGYYTQALGEHSHSEGHYAQSIGDFSHSEGYHTKALGITSHAEGCNTEASGNRAHAEGWETKANHDATHAEGKFTIADKPEAHAEGYGTVAGAESNEVTLNENIAGKGFFTHAEGHGSKATGHAAHSEGLKTIASGNYSHARGQGTIAKGIAQTTCGRYNIVNEQDLFIIGNGSSDTNRSNASTVDWQGNAWYAGAVTSNAADYAEFFEWLDGNPNNEDRVGYLVALDGEKIRFANPEDEILGIISANPAILGDNYECNWNGKYLTDEFGRILYDKVEEFIDIPKVDEETGETTIEKKSLGFFDHPRINPDYDPNQEYINRRNRSEWAIVGMLGKLFVRDDGTAQINGYVSTGEGGIATASTEKTNMRVLSRVNDHIVKVLLK